MVLKIIAIESRKTSSLNLEKDTSHWQSMSYKTFLRFNISRRETFFKSGFIRVMEKYYESALMEILQEFGIV